MFSRDMHIAKYNASFGQKRDHPAHKDKSMFSFVIALNSQRKKGKRVIVMILPVENLTVLSYRT